MSAAGANPRFAEATGLNVDKMRIIGTMLSTMLGAVGIIVYAQSFGFIQVIVVSDHLVFHGLCGRVRNPSGRRYDCPGADQPCNHRYIPVPGRADPWYAGSKRHRTPEYDFRSITNHYFAGHHPVRSDKIGR